MSSSDKKQPHEEFYVHTSAYSSSLVRPDRTVVDPEKCFLSINGTKYSVVNISPFGVAIISDHNDFNDQSKIKTQLIYENFELETLNIKVARIQNTVDSKYLIAFEVLQTPFVVEKIDAVTSAHQVMSKFLENRKQEAEIPELFRNLVYESKNWLEELEKQLLQIESIYKNEGHANWVEFTNTFADVISDFISEHFIPLYEDLNNALKNSTSTTKEIAVEFFRSKMGELIFQAPFAHRVFHKPLGYAGDFEMMNIIYQNQPIGTSLFSKCLHKCFVEEPAAEAVRNRAYYLVEKLKIAYENKTSNQPLKVISIASGPSREVQLFIEKYGQTINKGIEFYFIDQDVGALKFAQKKIRELQIKHGTEFNFHFENIAIKNIIGRGLKYKDFDLIYCAGLYDYLTDPVALMTTQKLFASVKSNGQLIIGNFSVSNPNKFWMSLALDWHLIYRDKEEFKNLLKAIDKGIDIEEESLGINLFAILNKT